MTTPARRICLTGATGFIGGNLLKQLQQRSDLQVIALSRRLSPQLDNARKGNVIWRRCDGFSMIDVENATRDTDILIYLIHSMLPSSSLTQGSFADFDLYLADNFAKAAHKNGVKKIIYLSGIIPPTEELSPHLASRLEVERTLSQYGNSLTSLRASLIVGKNGSSFKILERLTKRLPLAICPSWTNTKTQPIDIQDVMASLEHAIDHAEDLKETYDIGGPDILSYREMMKQTAEVLQLKRYTVSVPLVSPGLSKLWVAKVTSSPRNLVYPLVESLRHEMVVDESQRLLIPDHKYISFKDSLAKGLSTKKKSWVWSIIDYSANISFSWLRNVTSIQRVTIPTDMTAESAAMEYFGFLPRFMRPFFKVTVRDGKVDILAIGNISLITLTRSEDRSDDTREVFYVTGGALARLSTLNGRLEFRVVKSSQCLLIALLNFRPALPWFIYKYTQALVHLFVMRSFARSIHSKAD